MNEISTKLKENLSEIKSVLGKSNDIVIREFIIGKNERIEAFIIYIDGLSDDDTVNSIILKSLMIDVRIADLKLSTGKNIDWFDIIKRQCLAFGEIDELSNIDKVYESVLAGETVLLIDSCNKAISVDSKKWAQRGIEEPTTQNVIKGPKEGFTETLRTNTALIRRRVKNRNLIFKDYKLGEQSQTDVSLVYVEGIADDNVLSLVKNKIQNLNIEFVVGSAIIEDYLQGDKVSPFPIIYSSERPDFVATALMRGKIAILVDGTPFASILPAVFTNFFQTTEELYVRNYTGSFLMIIRFISYIIALLTPGVYCAVLTFHQEMLPTALYISIAAQRQRVPFPIAFEAFILELIFDILREAAVRMPRAVGPTISIVGALILGQASIEAGIFSPILIIVVAITAIATYVCPSYIMANASRLLRYAMLALGTMLGLPGLISGIIIIIFYLCSINSFGVPYMEPFVPKTMAPKNTPIDPKIKNIFKLILKNLLKK
jgi:spore germination protein KA